MEALNQLASDAHLKLWKNNVRMLPPDILFQARKRRQFNRSALGLAMLLALGQSPVVAEDTVQLPGLTVYGATAGEGLERLQKEQARDMKDVLGREVNVDVGGGVRPAQRFYLRGIESSNVNITIDGARRGQNLFNYRSNLGNVDPDILKQVEIRPGPPAADDGHGALGGSVRMVTVDAQDLLAMDQSIGARLRTGYTSADRGTRASASIYGLAGEQLGLLAHISRQDYEDMRQGDGERFPYSGGKDESYLLKLSLLDIGPHQFRLGRERHEASGLNYMQRSEYPWEVMDFRPPRDQSMVREQTTLDYRFDPSSPLLDIQVNFYQSENSWQVWTDDDTTQHFISDGQGYDLRNTFHYGRTNIRGALTVGADYLEDEGINRRTGRPDRRNVYENLGLYAQKRLEVEGGELWFGVRHDDFKANFRNNTTRTSNDATSYNIGGEVDVGAGVSIFSGYGEAARGAGTIPIHFAGNVAEDGAMINGSPTGELKPEVSRKSELGVRWRHEAVGASIGAEALTFRNRISDAILYAHASGPGGMGMRDVEEFYNADQTATFEGYELRAHYKQGPLRGSLGFMRLDTDGLPEQAHFLTRFGAPQGDKLIVHLDYSLRENLELGYTLNHVARLTDVPDGQNIHVEKPGYFVHDVRLNWQPLRMRQLSVDVAVRNLFDRAYSRHGSLSRDNYSPTLEPGRDIRVGMRYLF
ncbi:TonB-dependent receptor [Ectothiorhodospira haloalkaliphila]|uniref:TonB-dependent receptor domain-containing protein n=1 Tax=Ectothiorhodospira haloalkaliphila TaxID=421628 RepID=UPI001EE8BB4C|nr:TonB-dependent receptor [Ectothiorhodospira haloalkaliphila]MCG5524756.1 TonB-dependent receptor [Ectothiorhodospira haloalkaliphila]